MHVAVQSFRLSSSHDAPYVVITKNHELVSNAGQADMTNKWPPRIEGPWLGMAGNIVLIFQYHHFSAAVYEPRQMGGFPN